MSAETWRTLENFLISQRATPRVDLRAPSSRRPTLNVTASGLATTSSDAIAERFSALRASKRTALVAYLTAGHPDVATSVDVLRAVADAGADILEIGVPFSDPMADGPVIQASSQAALAAGVTLDRTLEIAARARLSIPLVLFSYLNPLMAAGPGVLQRAADAGFSGVLATDLPVGADPDRERWFRDGPLAFIRLVAPTTPVDRMRQIASLGSGFVYLISRTGVTGMRDALPADLPDTVARLRSVCTLPIAVGFGISRPEHAAAVGRIADGVVVGSALVQAVASGGANAAAALTRSLRTALDARTA
jgi:tryptophan synthase alpha chain